MGPYVRDVSVHATPPTVHRVSRLCYPKSGGSQASSTRRLWRKSGKCGTPRPSRGYARRISGRTVNTVHGLSLNFQAAHIKFFGLPLTLELVMARSIWTASLRVLNADVSAVC